MSNEPPCRSQPAVRTGLPFVVACALVALAMVCIADGLGRLDQRDFAIFYASGLAWRTSGAMYTGLASMNMNSPLLTATIFSPLSHLSLRSAFLVWTAAGAIALASTITLVTRATGGRLSWAGLGLLLTLPTQLVWMTGQVTWLLLPMVSCSWWHFRNRRAVLAGMWLAPVVTVKPTLALLALGMGPLVAAAAGMASALIAASGLLWTGYSPWLEWLQVGGGVHPFSWPHNLSIWGVLHRIRTGSWSAVSSMTPLTALEIAAVTLVATALLLVCRRLRGDPDAHWLVAFSLAILIAPLGWLYYVPLAFPALDRRFQSLGGSWQSLAPGLVLLVTPLTVLQQLGNSALSGSAYLLGFLLLWAGVLAPPRPPRTIAVASRDEAR